jgi:hypothetical protein
MVHCMTPARETNQGVSFKFDVIFGTFLGYYVIGELGGSSDEIKSRGDTVNLTTQSLWHRLTASRFGPVVLSNVVQNGDIQIR